MNIKHENILRDVLYNCDLGNTHYDTDRNRRYAQGVLVGVMSSIMAITGCTFEQALKEIRPYISDRFDPLVLPESWQNDFDQIVRHINK